MQILTWNTQKDFFGQRPELAPRGRRLDQFESEFGQLLADFHPDFFNLQEVSQFAREKISRVLADQSGYQLLQLPSQQEPGVLTQTAILFDSNKWQLADAAVLEFSLQDPAEPRAISALTTGLFENTARQKVAIGSLHQFARCEPAERLRQTALTRERLAGFGVPSLVTGDFNTGFPGENKKTAQFFAPEWQFVSREVGPTCFWDRLEPGNKLNILAARILGRLGMRLQIDHVFADSGWQQLFGPGQAQALTQFTASDHVPVAARFGAS